MTSSAIDERDPAASPAAAGVGADAATDALADARHALRCGDAPRARALLERWLESAAVAAQTRAAALVELGAALEQQGEFSAAMARHLQAEELAADCGAQALLLRAWLGMARVQHALGDAEQAAARLDAASRLLPAVDDMLLAVELNQQLGMALSRLERYDEAEACLLRVAACHAPQAAALRATGLNSLGVLWLHRGNHLREHGADAQAAYACARRWFEQAVGAARAAGDHHLEALAEGNIGTVAGSLGDLDAALAHFEAQLAALRALGDRPNQALALTNIGEAHRLAGHHAQAIAAQREALALGEALASLPRQRRALSELAACCEAQGDYAAALAHFKRFHALDRRIRDEAAEQKLVRMADRIAVQTMQREAEAARAERDFLRGANERLAREASSDALTGLGNRRRFDAEVGAALASQAHGTLALLDLDHFKRVNDAHGHLFGDQVLRRVAALLAAAQTGSGVYRLGGEEFALWLPEPPGGEPARAASVCEQLRRSVAQAPWDELAEGLVVTVSIGHARARGGEDLASLLARADAALYAAKRQGRNRVVAG
jgi:diguanylate cyclase (GGDEF)-like protein